VPKIFDRLCAGSVGYSILISAYAKVGQMDKKDNVIFFYLIPY
jgi:hypothetical protein